MVANNRASNEKASIDGVRFDSCLCLGFRKAARQTTKIYDEFLSEVGLRITQFGLLAHLEERGEPVTLTDLAVQLKMDPTTLNRNLKPLERQKLLSIKSSLQDRRVREIAMTAAGRRLFWKAAPLWKAAHEHLRQMLGLGEAARLAEVMSRSLRRMDAAEQSPVSRERR
jgi:DNA-binding MarR family transcriptional regulator